VNTQLHSYCYGAGLCCGGCREESGEVEGVSVDGGGEPSLAEQEDVQGNREGVLGAQGCLRHNPRLPDSLT